MLCRERLLLHAQSRLELGARLLLGLERLLQPRLILGHLRAVLRDLGRLLVGTGDADALVELRAQSLDLQRW